MVQVMCIQYWPPALEKTEVYGDIHIGIVNEEQLANFQIRTFRIWKETLDVSPNSSNIHLTIRFKNRNKFGFFFYSCVFFLTRMSLLKREEYFNSTTPNGIRTQIHFQMLF